MPLLSDSFSPLGSNFMKLKDKTIYGHADVCRLIPSTLESVIGDNLGTLPDYGRKPFIPHFKLHEKDSKYRRKVESFSVPENIQVSIKFLPFQKHTLISLTPCHHNPTAFKPDPMFKTYF